MSVSSYINWKNGLGLSAAFYFGSYLHIRGGMAEAPLLLLGFFALFATVYKHKSKTLDSLSRNERWFVLALFMFGAWSAFTVWLDAGDSSFYETPARFIVGSLVAIPILKNRVDIRWVQLGVAVSTVLLIQLVLTTYQGGRFAPTMNATKWGNALAFQSLLCASLAILTRRTELKLFFTLSAIFGIYSTSITGTRGAMLPIVIGLVLLGIFSVKSPKGWLAAITGLVIVAVLAQQIPVVKNRITATEHEVSRILNDDFSGSMGQRLTMWLAGAQAGLRNPILGGGYDYAETMRSFTAPSDGLAKAAEQIARVHSNHHSGYIDSLARSGLIGLGLLLFLLFTGIQSVDRSKLILAVAPFAGFAVAGLSDSALMLGITVTYLTLAGSLLKATEDPM